MLSWTIILIYLSLGMHTTFLGFMLTIQAAWLMFPFVFYAINIDLIIRQEDMGTVNKFGKQYIDSQSITPKYLLI